MSIVVADESGAPFFYANVMQAHIGAYDFTIDFGYRRPDQSASRQFDPICTVGMSISHAKTMLPILARLIAAYESQFGTIPAPGYDEQARE